MGRRCAKSGPVWNTANTGISSIPPSIPTNQPASERDTWHASSLQVTRHAFLAAYGPIAQLVRPRRPLLLAPIERQAMRQRFQSWREVTSLAAAASACLLMNSCPALPGTHVDRRDVDKAL